MPGRKRPLEIKIVESEEPMTPQEFAKAEDLLIELVARAYVRHDHPEQFGVPVKPSPQPEPEQPPPDWQI